MTTLLPFIRVPDVGLTKSWYESIDFTCAGTHVEPGCSFDVLEGSRVHAVCAL